MKINSDSIVLVPLRRVDYESARTALHLWGIENITEEMIQIYIENYYSPFSDDVVLEHLKLNNIKIKLKRFE